MSVFRACLTYVHFYFNQDYIATELCEQKAIIDNTCEGHCQLQKELSEEADNKHQNTSNSRITIKENLHNVTELFQFCFSLGPDLNQSPVLFSFKVKTFLSSPDIPPPRA